MIPRNSMMARLILLGGACLFIMGAYSKCTATFGDPIGMPGNNQGFTVVLIIRDSSGTQTTNFAFGEPMRFDLVVTNRANQSASMQFNDSHTNDFLVVNSGARDPRWLWSRHRAFTQVLTEVPFGPYESRTFTVTWNGILDNGTQITAGTYQARGVMVFDAFGADPLAPSDMGSSLMPFTVH